MNLIRPAVPWSEVASCWVRAELTSERFAHLYENAGETDEERLAIARADYFEDFPTDVEWCLVALTPEEIATVLYIDWDYWLDVTDGTRRPADAIRKMSWHDTEMPPPRTERLILLADSSASPTRVVVLEGHSRLTSYVAHLDDLPPELECYLGVSGNISGWACY